jgi:hypothetical protein
MYGDDRDPLPGLPSENVPFDGQPVTPPRTSQQIEADDTHRGRHPFPGVPETTNPNDNLVGVRRGGAHL